MRKAVAVILVLGATVVIALACVWFVFSGPDFMRRVGTEVLIAVGLAMFAASATLWKRTDNIRGIGTPGPGERRCGICGTVVAESGGRWKVLAKPGFGDMEAGWEFVCASCLRASWRNALLLLLLLGALALTGWVVMTFAAR